MPLAFDFELFFLLNYIYARLVAGLSVNEGLSSYGELNVRINEGRVASTVGSGAYVMLDFSHQAVLLAIWLVSHPAQPLPRSINCGWRPASCGDINFDHCVPDLSKYHPEIIIVCFN